MMDFYSFGKQVFQLMQFIFKDYSIVGFVRVDQRYGGTRLISQNTFNNGKDGGDTTTSRKHYQVSLDLWGKVNGIVTGHFQ